MAESLNHSVHLPQTPSAQPAHSGPPRMPITARWLAGIVLVSAAIGAGTGAGTLALLDDGGSSTTTTTATLPAAAASAPAITNTSGVSVADLYTRLRPSIVKIGVSSATSAGTGSGIVLDTQGHIATNYHVVGGASQIDVTMADGTVVSGQVVGTDPGDDLAVIQIPTTGLTLTPVKLADSSQTRVGDEVVAIGNPLDLEATLTEGVVSGLGRVLSAGNGGRPLRELIQTDTAINPGNSGGGLFNLNGELVGITNALENPTGQDSFSGIGYAIPASTLQKYLPDMLAGRTVSHAKLGVSLVTLTPSIARELNINVDNGVMVGAVDPGSAAARAGLEGATPSRAGDIIVAIDGNKVGTYDDIASYLDTKNPGDTIKMTVQRNGQQKDLNVTLDAWTTS